MGPLGFGAGGGSVMAPLALDSGTITASAPALTITQTWNAGGETFVAFDMNVDAGSSAAASMLMNLRVGGASKFSVRKDGLATGDAFSGTSYGDSSQATTRYAFGSSNRLFLYSSALALIISGQNLILEKTSIVGWDAVGGFADNPDVAIARNAAGVMEINSGAAGTFRDLILRNIEIDGNLNHDGAGVGFYGTAPVAQQTGVTVDAAGIHAALVNLGLITA